MGNFKVIPKDTKEQIIHRIKNEGVSVATAAKDAGICPRTIYGWLSSGTYATPGILEINKLRRENQFLLGLVGKLTMEQAKTMKGKKT